METSPRPSSSVIATYRRIFVSDSIVKPVGFGSKTATFIYPCHWYSLPALRCDALREVSLEANSDHYYIGALRGDVEMEECPVSRFSWTDDEFPHQTDYLEHALFEGEGLWGILFTADDFGQLVAEPGIATALLRRWNTTAEAEIDAFLSDHDRMDEWMTEVLRQARRRTVDGSVL